MELMSGVFGIFGADNHFYGFKLRDMTGDFCKSRPCALTVPKSFSTTRPAHPTCVMWFPFSGHIETRRRGRVMKLRTFRHDWNYTPYCRCFLIMRFGKKTVFCYTLFTVCCVERALVGRPLNAIPSAEICGTICAFTVDSIARRPASDLFGIGEST